MREKNAIDEAKIYRYLNSEWADKMTLAIGIINLTWEWVGTSGKIWPKKGGGINRWMTYLCHLK